MSVAPVQDAAPSIFDAPGYDVIAAVTDLCSRVGCHTLEIGYQSITEQGEGADWYATAGNEEAQSAAHGHTGAVAACYALAGSLVDGLTCGCGLSVTLTPGPEYGPGGARAAADAAAIEGWCLWQQMTSRWVPSCELIAAEAKQLAELQEWHAQAG